MTFKRKPTLKQIRHSAMFERLKEYRGCVQGAASSLDITRNTLYRELSKEELEIARGISEQEEAESTQSTRII